MSALNRIKILSVMGLPVDIREEPAQKLYAVIDPSRDSLILPTMKAYASSYECLYSGEAKNEFGKDAPWLVELKQDEAAFDWLISEVFGTRSMCFLASRSDLGRLRLHLKKFIRIETPQRESLFFRFADPQTLSAYLRFFSAEQRERLFQEIDVIGFEIGEKAFMSVSLDEALQLNWTLTQCVGDDGFPDASGSVPPPPADITEGSSAKPLLRFSQNQLDIPIILNGELLIDELDGYLRDDFGHRMNAYPKALLRMMLDYGAHLAIKTYKISDLSHIKLFVGLMWRIAPGYHREPTLNAVLKQVNRSAASRFDQLLLPNYSNAWARATEYNASEEWHPFGSDKGAARGI